MPHVLQFKGNGTFFCAEPPYVVRKKGEPEQALGGEWSAVDRADDATRFTSRNAAVRTAQENGLTSTQWAVLDPSQEKAK